ncbi:MAG: hypothetical protein OXG49_11735 [Chloroflexi bacterium]|nr:hypothetical protein [Chloroflexota bacterium]
MKFAWRLLLMVGILIAILGAGSDFLLPSTSPGLNLPQVLVIVAGIALSLSALWLRRAQLMNRGFGGARKTLLKVALVTLATLILLEIVLGLWGRPTYFPRRRPERNVKEIPWGICDELGCRKRYEAVLDACATGYLAGIRCVINRDGFGDTDEFVAGEDFSQRNRILIMGDSYTRGFHAEVGKSYVDRLEEEMPDAIVWNVAEPGTATNQALLSFAGIAPRLQPQLSILGFYMNDFPENLVPKDMSLRLIDDEGKQYFVTRFEQDRWGNPVELPAEEVYAYLALGATPPSSELERLLGITHLGTLALRTLDYFLGLDGEDLSFDRQKRVTRAYLAQLRDDIAAMDSQFLVLLIPGRDDVVAPRRPYQTARQLFEELRIPYLEARHVLKLADYTDHWNTEGHQKVGALLSDCVIAFFESGDFASCERVAMPE